ncbi:bursicon-like [Saccoglossus kowalevskii]
MQNWGKIVLILSVICVDIGSPLCSTQSGMRVINIPGCKSKRVLAVGCRGSCESYAALRNSLRIEYSCQCCSPVSSSTHSVRLYCPNLGGTRTVEFESASECMCRPCSYMG